MAVLRNKIGDEKRARNPYEVVLPFLSANLSSLTSRSSGTAMPFVVPILVKISAASFVLDLQISHLGDSGTSLQETKKTNRGITEAILINLQDAKYHPVKVLGITIC